MFTLRKSLITPHPFQVEAIKALHASAKSGNKKIVLQAATGSGKTVVTAGIIREYVELGKKAVFIAHRWELVKQAADKLERMGVPAGIIMAGEELTDAPVQVCSKDTLLARAIRTCKMQLPPADLVIVDECHRVGSSEYQRLLAEYPDAQIIGPSATPALPNGGGMGAFFDDLVVARSVSKLIEEQYLVPARCFVPHVPNLKGVKVQRGDYVQRQLEERMDRPRLVGDIILTWERIAGPGKAGEPGGRPTLVFASGIRHSMHLRDRYIERGHKAAHVDAKTPTDERDDIIKRFLSGEITVVTNCAVFTEGTDLPLCSCIVLACPTRSRIKFFQTIGRGMRTWLGKTDMVMLDHAGALNLHGFPDEDIEWSLDVSRQIQDVYERAKQEGKVRAPITCPECYATYAAVSGCCPNCQYVFPQRTPLPQEEKDGRLVEVTRQTDVPFAQMQRAWNKFISDCVKENKKVSSALGRFKSRFNKLPWDVEGLKPMPMRGEWGQSAKEMYPGMSRVPAARG